MATKGIKMDDEALKRVNERIEASGMDAGEWLESLMALETIHTLGKADPAVEYELKDLEKHVNRIYHILIRMYQRGADAVEEIKEQSLEEQTRIAGELEEMRIELSIVQKQLKQKEEELGDAYSTNGDMRVKMEQLEKTTKAVEESFRLTTEKMEMLQKRIEELQGADQAAAEAKEQMQELKLSHANELALKKEEEAKLNQSISDMQKEIASRQMQFDEEMDRVKNNHARELEMLRKDLEMKAKEELLQVKEESQTKINQINEQHAAKMAELVDKIAKK